MYSDFLNGLAKKTAAYDKFYIRGLKLNTKEDIRLDSTTSQLLYSYFEHKENVCYFSSPNLEKLVALKEIAQKLKEEHGGRDVLVVVTTGEHVDGLTEFLNVPVFLSDELLNQNSYEYVVYYNRDINHNIISSNIHVSGFYDYISLFDADYRTYVNSKLALLPESFNYTTICRLPVQKQVQFVFGTSNNIKHLAVPQNQRETGAIEEQKEKYTESVLYHSNTLPANIEKQLKLKNHVLITDISSCTRCNQFIFYDLNTNSAEQLFSLLNRADHILIVYTTEDFPILKEMIKCVVDRDLKVPESLMKLL